jgi:hypothetical protein
MASFLFYKPSLARSDKQGANAAIKGADCDNRFRKIPLIKNRVVVAG